MTLLDLLDEAGLTGRGGAAFPTSTKVRSALANRARLIVNACDGEVGNAKDAFVIANHLAEVVHGAQLLSTAVHFAAHRGSSTEHMLTAAGLAVLPVPARYVSSEESSLVNLLAGGLARPFTRHAPVTTGARTTGGKQLPPTLVLNAETVLRISQIEQYGPRWFRSFGTDAEPGPRLVTIGGNVQRPGVYQTAAGVPLSQLLRSAGASPGSALGLSGLSGGWLRGSEAVSAVWSDAYLERFELRTGTGAIHVLDPSECGVNRAAQMLEFAAGESAGQCGPCMFGVPAVAEQFARLAAGALDASELNLLRGRLGLLAGRGACRFPDAVGAFAASALRAFWPEVQVHLLGGCTASGVRGHVAV